jgi:hypothetical protein
LLCNEDETYSKKIVSKDEFVALRCIPDVSKDLN